MLTNRLFLASSALTVAILAAAAFIVVSGGSSPSSAEPGIDISEQQEAIIADGVVTDEEYLAAVEATLQCLRDGGFTDISGPEWDVTGKILDYTVSYAPESSEEVLALHDECFLFHAGFAKHYRDLANRPNGEQLAVARQTLVNCLRDAGVIESEAELDTARDRNIEAYTGCTVEASAASGIPSYGG